MKSIFQRKEGKVGEGEEKVRLKWRSVESETAGMDKKWKLQALVEEKTTFTFLDFDVAM